jgi:hypothetical protein
MAPGVEMHQEADRQCRVGHDIGDVQNPQHATVRQKQLLEPRLDMDAEPPFERDHPLGVPRGLHSPCRTALAAACQQIERVHAQADRHLAPTRESPVPFRPPSHSSTHTYLQVPVQVTLPRFRRAKRPTSHLCNRSKPGMDGMEEH